MKDFKPIIVAFLLALLLVLIIKTAHAETITATYKLIKPVTRVVKNSAPLLCVEKPLIQKVNNKLSGELPIGDVQQKVYLATVATFGENHWEAMKFIVSHESGFRPDAINASSGACGLFQALPCSKMGGMALDNQIVWGMSYVRARYGTPINAMAFWQVHNWY